jgi:hypothetical protein
MRRLQSALDQEEDNTGEGEENSYYNRVLKNAAERLKRAVPGKNGKQPTTEAQQSVTDVQKEPSLNFDERDDECPVCVDGEANFIAKPCGHRVLCVWE